MSWWEWFSWYWEMDVSKKMNNWRSKIFGFWPHTSKDLPFLWKLNSLNGSESQHYTGQNRQMCLQPAGLEAFLIGSMEDKAFPPTGGTTSDGWHHGYGYGEEKGEKPFPWAPTALGELVIMNGQSHMWREGGVKTLGPNRVNESKSFGGLSANQSYTQCQEPNNLCFFF